MKMFMIEWWNSKTEMWNQEYYLQYPSAFERFTRLSQDVLDSNPEIATLFLDNE